MRRNVISIFAMFLLTGAVIFGVLQARAQTVSSDLPGNIDPGAHYLFYMHGLWLEKKTQSDEHPLYGFNYAYHEVLEALAAKGVTVIGEIRKGEDKNRDKYGAKVADQVRALLDAGVPPGHITVSGHSKGGINTIVAADLLDNPDVKFAIVAGCLSFDKKFGKAYRKFLKNLGSEVVGRFYSLYEVKDHLAGSCDATFKRFGTSNTAENALTVGGGHGLFYQPKAVWIDPLIDFVKAP